jgi:hypothetical protein
LVEPAVAVSAELCDEVLLKVSEVGERLHVGSVELESPDGLVVTAQLSVTVPVNELPGVTVIVSVLVDVDVTSMAPLLPSEKLVLLLFGACQKSPQPPKSVAAAIKPAQHPILITAPCVALWPRRRSVSRLQANACRGILSCPPAPRPAEWVDAIQTGFAWEFAANAPLSRKARA